MSDGQSERENTKGRWGLYHQGSYMLLRSFIFLMVFNFLIKKLEIKILFFLNFFSVGSGGY